MTIKPILPNLAFSLTIVASALNSARLEGQGFYVIAHMTNTPKTVQWALDQGANGLEMDLQFDSTGTPTVFQHGGTLTDCTCATYGICRAYDGSPATSNTPAPQHLSNIATKPGVALVIIDSKVDDSWPIATKTAAGGAAVKLLEDNLLAKGYRGQIVISVGFVTSSDYLRAVAERAANSVYRSRIHFTFDQEGNGVANALNTLVQYHNSNRVYGTGVSACSPTQYYGAIALGVKNRNAGIAGLVYTWTIDKPSSINRYLDLRLDGIITNDPAALKSAVDARGLMLAKPASTIPSATSGAVIER